MPYTKQHKVETRKKILESAINLFTSKGYDQVSIDELMQHANLTRGAFYAHFKNKQALYAQAIIAGVRKSRIREKKPTSMTNQEWAKNLLGSYLSMEHVNQESDPCPLAFLVTDVANKEPQVKQAYTRIYKQLNLVLQKLYGEPSENKEQDILAITAMMIGGVAIGRALNDSETSEKLLDSCRKTAHELLE